MLFKQVSYARLAAFIWAKLQIKKEILLQYKMTFFSFNFKMLFIPVTEKQNF